MLPADRAHFVPSVRQQPARSKNPTQKNSHPPCDLEDSQGPKSACAHKPRKSLTAFVSSRRYRFPLQGTRVPPPAPRPPRPKTRPVFASNPTDCWLFHKSDCRTANPEDS